MEFVATYHPETENEIIFRLDPIPKTEEEKKALDDMINERVEIADLLVYDAAFARANSIKNQFHFHWDVYLVERIYNSTSYLVTLKKTDDKPVFF
jgi:hypothetical protein